MALPIHTTLITISRSDQDGTLDALDVGGFTTVASGIRAHVGSPSGTETRTSSESTLSTARLSADPCDLRHGDRVRDETTGLTYDVTFVAQRTGFGLDHTAADLVLVIDRAAV